MKFIIGAMLLLSQAVWAGDQFDSIPFPYYAKQVTKATDAEKNELMILDSGIESLKKRIDMIRRAEKSIVIEYFIFRPDDGGKMIVSELIKKKKENPEIEIKLLIDKSITVIQFDDYYGVALEKYGIEVAYYRRALDPSTMQFRNHRKILAIDYKEAMTGGRNIGVEYFDMDPHYNFHDRDVWIKGPMAWVIQNSFDEYWRSEPVKRAKEPTQPEFSRFHRGNTLRRLQPKIREHQRRLQEAAEFMLPDPKMEELKEKALAVGAKYLERNKAYHCPVLTFASDAPTLGFSERIPSGKYLSEYRHLRKLLIDRIENVKEKIFVSSPYYLLNDTWQDLMHGMLDRGVDVSIFTNTLAATDAVYVSAGFYRQIFPWVEKGKKVFMHSSDWDADEVISESMKEVRYGLHAKSFIFDDESIMIGTFNIDNRSDYYNNEMGVFCDGSPELTNQLIGYEARRLKQAYLLTGENQAMDAEGNYVEYLGEAESTAAFLMKLLKYPSVLFEFIM